MHGHNRNFNTSKSVIRKRSTTREAKQLDRIIFNLGLDRDMDLLGLKEETQLRDQMNK